MSFVPKTTCYPPMPGRKKHRYAEAAPLLRTLQWLREQRQAAEAAKADMGTMTENRLYTYRLGISDALGGAINRVEEELAALGFEDTTKKEGRP